MGIRANYELSGRLNSMLLAIQDPDFDETIAKASVIMEEDHVRGVMAGTGGDGNKLIDVTYRNGKAAPLKRKVTLKSTRFNRPAMTEAGDNLTNAEYRKLTGPPLAPRGLDSRVIRNYEARTGRTSDSWFAEASLVDIVSRKGKPFIEAHFDGLNNLPRRDLRGIRRQGMDKILRLVGIEIRRQFFNRS